MAPRREPSASPRVLRALAWAALAALWVLAATRRTHFPLGAPVALSDQRAGRLGALPYHEAERQTAALRAARDQARSPAERAITSAHLADVYVSRRLYRDAREAIEVSYAIAPEQPEVLERRALILAALGDRAQADAMADALARVAPARVGALRALIARQSAAP